MIDPVSPLEPSHLASLVFAAALLSSVLLQFWLATRQMRHVTRHRDRVPEAFSASVDLCAHQKAADYTVAKARTGVLALAWGAFVTLGWTLLGGLRALDAVLLQATGPGLLQGVALLVAFVVLNSLLDLPFTLYQTFVLEQRFGFNKTTPMLWLQDMLKSLLLGLLIGLPLAAAFLWMMASTGRYWWLWTWCLWMAFNLGVLLIYPTWIAPWFNRFTPLQDPLLQTRVAALMQRCGFKAQGFYVMDGSRRSAHANAYFTGLGRSKRVVFYDTLLAQLSADEVDAVLAHELGHFHHRHIVQRVVTLFAASLLAFAALGALSQTPWFYTGLGVMPHADSSNAALALLLFMLATPPLGTWITPVLAQLSRRHEFEADAYAAAHAKGSALASALLTLYRDNASTLTPDPVYVRFYYSHPAASERLGRIAAQAA